MQVDSVTVPVTGRKFSKHAKVVRLFHRHYTEKYLSVIGQGPREMQVRANRVVREVSQKWVQLDLVRSNHLDRKFVWVFFMDEVLTMVQLKNRFRHIFQE